MMTSIHTQTTEATDLILVSSIDRFLIHLRKVILLRCAVKIFVHRTYGSLLDALVEIGLVVAIILSIVCFTCVRWTPTLRLMVIARLGIVDRNV